MPTTGRSHCALAGQRGMTWHDALPPLRDVTIPAGNVWCPMVQNVHTCIWNAVGKTASHPRQCNTESSRLTTVTGALLLANAFPTSLPFARRPRGNSGQFRGCQVLDYPPAGSALRTWVEYSITYLNAAKSNARRTTRESLRVGITDFCRQYGDQPQTSNAIQ